MDVSHYTGPVADSHFHVWYCPGEKYDFPTPDMSVISSDMTMDDYKQAISSTNIQSAVFIQVLNANENEIDWIYQLSKKYSVMKGMVGGVDLGDPEFSDKVGGLIEKTGGFLKGIRHILEGETESEMLGWLKSDVVAQNVALLSENNLSFDLLLKPNLIEAAYQLVKRCPHSGLVVLADYERGNVTAELFLRYVKHIVKCFGPERIMFGSDWPVCHLADFCMSDVVRLITELMVKCGLNSEQMEAFFYKNATTFYRLQQQ